MVQAVSAYTNIGNDITAPGYLNVLVNWSNIINPPSTYPNDTVASSKATWDSVVSLSANNITSDIMNPARLGTGTPDGTKFLRDDGVWSKPTTTASLSYASVNLTSDVYLNQTNVAAFNTTTSIYAQLFAINDTYVNQSSAATNYGGHRNLFINESATNANRIYARYNVSSITNRSGVNITGAFQNLNVFGAGTTTTASVYHQLNDSFGENTTTWANQPCPGAGCNATAESTIATLGSTGLKNWTVTNMMKNVTANATIQTNLSIYTKTAEASSLTRANISSNQNTTANAPFLNVSYTYNVTTPASYNANVWVSPFNLTLAAGVWQIIAPLTLFSANTTANIIECKLNFTNSAAINISSNSINITNQSVGMTLSGIGNFGASQLVTTYCISSDRNVTVLSSTKKQATTNASIMTAVKIQ